MTSGKTASLTLNFSISYEIKLGIFFQFFLFSFQHCSAFQVRFSARPFAYWASAPGEHCLSSVAMVPFSCHKKLLPLVAFYLFGSCYSFFSSLLITKLPLRRVYMTVYFLSCFLFFLKKDIFVQLRVGARFDKAV